MSRNHRNRSWQAQWTVSEHDGVLFARHRSGILAMQGEDGEVLLDTSLQAGPTETLSVTEQKCRLQAERLFAELAPADEPDLGPAPGM